MMEWIIAILVVVIVLMAAYIRGLWSTIDSHKEAERHLRDLVEESEHTRVRLNREADQASSAMYEMLSGVANYFGYGYDRITHGEILQCSSQADYFKRSYQEMIEAGVSKIRKEASAGNREELVSQLSTLYRDLGLPSKDFDTFMQELTTLPGAAANRIELYFMRRG